MTPNAISNEELYNRVLGKIATPKGAAIVGLGGAAFIFARQLLTAPPGPQQPEASKPIERGGDWFTNTFIGPSAFEWGRGSGFGVSDEHILKNIAEEYKENSDTEATRGGTAIHEKIQSALTGINSSVQTEIPLYDPEARLTGHIDILAPINYNGKTTYIPTEIKTVEDEAALEALHGIKSEQRAQGQFYLHYLSNEHPDAAPPGEFFLYTTRQDQSRYKLFFLERNEAEFQGKLSHYRQIQRKAEAAGLTPQRFEPQILDYPARFSSWIRNLFPTTGTASVEEYEQQLHQAMQAVGMHNSSAYSIGHGINRSNKDHPSDFGSPRTLWNTASSLVSKYLVRPALKLRKVLSKLKPLPKVDPTHLMDFQALFRNPEFAFETDIIKKLSKEGFALTGSTALSSQGTMYRPPGNPFHDLDFISTKYKPDEIHGAVARALGYPDEAIAHASRYSPTDMDVLIVPREASHKIHIPIRGRFHPSHTVTNAQGNLLDYEGKFIDFFSTPDRLTQTVKIEGTDDSILVAHHKAIFDAKRSYGRVKDRVDEKNFKLFPGTKQHDGSDVLGKIDGVEKHSWLRRLAGHWMQSPISSVMSLADDIVIVGARGGLQNIGITQDSVEQGYSFKDPLAPNYIVIPSGVRSSRTYESSYGGFEAMQPHPGTDFPGGRSSLWRKILGLQTEQSAFTESDKAILNSLTYDKLKKIILSSGRNIRIREGAYDVSASASGGTSKGIIYMPKRLVQANADSANVKTLLHELVEVSESRKLKSTIPAFGSHMSDTVIHEELRIASALGTLEDVVAYRHRELPAAAFARHRKASTTKIIKKQARKSDTIDKYTQQVVDAHTYSKRLHKYLSVATGDNTELAREIVVDNGLKKTYGHIKAFEIAQQRRVIHGHVIHAIESQNTSMFGRSSQLGKFEATPSRMGVT